MTLTTWGLAYLRGLAEDLMLDSCAIKAATETSDGAGGASVAWATTATVACGVEQTGRAPEERMVAEKLALTTAFTVRLPRGTAVTVANRLLVGGVTYQVRHVSPATAEAIDVRCVCEVVQ
jgi:SPP1 family predicted phage head-tail adaptor